ncbi:MAG: zinc ribbon domain-containing protein [Anaerolineales bacterium]|nr:zinc ribbon domain-containing protein [Anaerolineales bacterium]
MELGSIFLLLAVIVLVGVYLYAPFMARARRVAGESYEVSALLAKRDRVINSLQELDFDNNLGKIPADEYAPQRALLLQKGADILRKLDELSSPSPLAHLPKGERNRGDAEARIEKEVSARRADSPVKAAELSDDDIESMLAARRQKRKDKSVGFCPKCGKPVLVTDRFCPACGKSLT